MPRIARFVVAGVPHHVTQRGNRRGTVFFCNDDRRSYLRLLRDYATEHAVEVLAYCLMTNHVHLVAVPRTADGLHRMLRPLHMRHAQRVNRAHGWKGHLWQGRYFSSALDDEYLWAAIRYVELNPIRAGMVRRAQDYGWSSAAAHCGIKRDPLLSASDDWRRRLGAIGDWSAWLAAGESPDSVELLRRRVDKGLPCGSTEFVEALEQASGKDLRDRPRGRQKGDANHSDAKKGCVPFDWATRHGCPAARGDRGSSRFRGC